MPEMWEVQQQLSDEATKYEAWKHSGGGGPQKGWHIDALCSRLGFSNDEANVIKSEFTSVFQRLFGGNAIQNTPQQFEEGRSLIRKGDPVGAFGSLFRIFRKIYYVLENVPLVNDLRLWAAIDQIVLARCKNPVVIHFLESLKHSHSHKVTHQHL